MASENKKPILVITGSAGKMGTALRAALETDYEIVGCDRSADHCEIPIDLSSDASVETAFKYVKEKYGSQIATVIHLAAYFDFTGEPSSLYKEVNEEGTQRLLKVLQAFDVEQFIYSSTMLVHKPCKPGEVITEESPLAPQWAYPKSKFKTEQIIEKHHGNIPYLILRIAGLYDDRTCVPTLAHQIARIYERDIKSQLYAGDLEAGQAFIHQEDLIALFKSAIKQRHDLEEKEILLVGEPDTLSYQSLQLRIKQLVHGKESKTYTIPAPMAKMGAWIQEHAEPFIPDDIDQGEKPFIRPFMIDMASHHYALDISKAREKLGFEPKHRLKDRLPKLVEALKKNPQGWYEDNKLKLPAWMNALGGKHAEKTRKEYETSFRKAHQQNLWAHFLNIALGFWLIASPATLGYASLPLTISDISSGVIVVILAFICLSWRFAFARWICAGIGLWLIFAPLIFWAPGAAAYLNDTLTGSLIIGFSVLVRPSVGVAPNAAIEEPFIPPGWNFSPSSWFQRFPIIILAFVGLFISRYMAAYQLGHIDSVWDPFFAGNLSKPENGTEEIITSSLSKSFPVPDAGLGAAVYMLEILTGLIGGANRWRTMPWLVLLFGILIVPLGIVSIAFIIIQPIVFNTWCTLCLIAAASMLLQVPYSFDELVATGHFLWRRWRVGRPFWLILFVGDTDEIDEKNKGYKEDNFEQSPKTIIKDIITGGVTFPWTLCLCVVIGVWLMLTRTSLGASESMANANHLIGSLIITVSICACAESVRALRFFNLFLALLLCISPFVFAADVLGMIASLLAGLLVFALSLPRGKIVSNYGAWDKAIF